MILEELLNKFQDIFSRSPEDIGRTNKIKHSIDTGDAHPGDYQLEREKWKGQKILERGSLSPYTATEVHL